jgi:hypothetical protein
MQEGPIQLPLWQWRSLWLIEIDTQVTFLSIREDKEIAMCEITWAWKVWQMVTCWFTSSSWTTTECYAGVLSWSKSEFLLHESSGGLWGTELHSWLMISLLWCLLTVAPSGMNSMWTIPDEFEKDFKHYLASWPILSQFLLSRWWCWLPGCQLSLQSWIT